MNRCRPFFSRAFAKSVARETLWICSSDIDLDEALAAGDFSMKLYFQISGKVIDLPRLNERADDLPEMVAARAAMECKADSVDGATLRGKLQAAG